MVCLHHDGSMLGTYVGDVEGTDVGWAVSPKAAETLHDVGLRSRRLLRNPVPDVDAPLSMTVL